MATAVFFALFVFPKTLIAQAKPAAKFAPVTKGLVLPDVECSEFHSEFTGHDYNVYVSLPESYTKGDQRYTVLYVPDIDENFPILKGTSRPTSEGGLGKFGIQCCRGSSMKLGKRLGRIGFAIGFVGSIFFYVSPFSWFTFESHWVCPWCPYIDVAFPDWLSWLQLGLTVGLGAGLLLALVGFSVGCFVSLVRVRKLGGPIQTDPLAKYR